MLRSFEIRMGTAWRRYGMSELTFRDFAGAVMGGDAERAAEVLSQLLGVELSDARSATSIFSARMAEGPEFVQKAMSMRGAVAAKDETLLRGLLVDCFGLTGEQANGAAATLLARAS